MLAVEEQEQRDWLSRAKGRIEAGVMMPRRDGGKADMAAEVRYAWWCCEAALDLARVYDDGIYEQQWQSRLTSAWLRVHYELERSDRRRDQLCERYLPPTLDPSLRAVFRLAPNQTQVALLGERDESGVFRAGLAGLTEPEWHAFTLALEPIPEEIVHFPKHGIRGVLAEERVQNIIILRPRQVWEIARDMVSQRRTSQFGRRAAIKDETVERYLRSARGKLRVLFWSEVCPIGDGDPEENPL